MKPTKEPCENCEDFCITNYNILGYNDNLFILLTRVCLDCYSKFASDKNSFDHVG